MPEYEYKWATKPPITKHETLRYTSFRAMLMEKSVNKYSEDMQKHSNHNFSSTRTKPHPNHSPEMISNTLLMCKTIQELKPTSTDTLRYEYTIEGTPVALLVMKQHKDCAYICDLVTHPGVESAGPIMLEHALRESTTKKLKLWPLNDTCKPAYIGMGFVEMTDGHMLLDLTQGERGKWQHPAGGDWTYVSATSPGEQYAVATKVEANSEG